MGIYLDNRNSFPGLENAMIKMTCAPSKPAIY